MKVYYTFFFSLFITLTFAQIDTKSLLKDKIILQNGSVKKVTVIEANETGVKYKTTSDGEVQTVSADKVIIVLDENNNKLKFYGCSDGSAGGDSETETTTTTTTSKGNCQNPAQNSNCESNKSGHVCFKNTTTKKIYLDSDENMTLLPGECKCDYDLHEGGHDYKAYYMTNDQATGNPFDTGEYYIIKCKNTAVDIRDK